MTNDRIERIAKMEARIAALPALNDYLAERVASASILLAAARFSEERGHVNKASASEDSAYRILGFVSEEIARDPKGSAARRGFAMTYRTVQAV